MSVEIDHHFVPKALLRRFCYKKNQLYSFDKVRNRVNIRDFSPSAICYVPHLHTLIHGDERFLEIEKFYGQIEDQFLNFIRKADELAATENGLKLLGDDPSVQQIISLLIAVSYWRIPHRIAAARKAKLSLRKFFDECNDKAGVIAHLERKDIRDLERKRGPAADKLTQFLALPLLHGRSTNDALKRCKVVATEFDLIISDDPVICEIDPSFSFSGDIYMPIGPRLCITNAPEKIPIFQKKLFNNAQKIVIARSRTIFTQFCNTNL